MTPSTSTKKEVLGLIGLVIALDVVFVVAYFLLRIRHASDTAKLTFTVVWTLAVLIVSLRGLSRIRTARLGSVDKERSS
jgi:hypothetical protein